jgi:hypothetical protein
MTTTLRNGVHNLEILLFILSSLSFYMFVFDKADLESVVIPREVHHIVLMKCFYSKAHVNYRDEKISHYRDTGRRDIDPPSMLNNVMEVILLEVGAKRYQASRCYMFVKNVREWIVKNFKKTGSKYVLNKITQSSPSKISIIFTLDSSITGYRYYFL